ncbi:phytoene desaturase family protein [Peloplasma aerotolerans]|uniref:NAD(P)/FAD-dependent oxidoreductase n=1 Tax=Peloplasma aerotolerans TaxID=3044389 RepID=A0AAW6U722_9MOLU|nr:NAD(P)/FAD-dependent oxidoreductase [Mariniplasma sp. M4Ah]MDI6453758.1 NAD(P)/FAD-dependent oxidoreductase [Mariniplasma sp. M4Ah]MDR4968054.1 NAD(P)/FAD-dependent oxidoreductase [Acholeplasmataceae bacterium]
MNTIEQRQIEKIDIVVIGAGISGLVATAYLAKNKRNARLYEKNQSLGGLVGTFERQGFYFDHGARAFENSGILFPMLKNLNISFDYVKNPVKLGIGTDFVDVTTKDSLESYQNLLIKYFPEEKKAIEQIIKEIDHITKLIEVVYEIDNPLFYEGRYKMNYLLKTLLPWLKRFKNAQKESKSYLVSVIDYLYKYTSNQALIDIITQHFFEESSAYFTLSYFGLYKDYLYPKKGTKTLAQVLKDAILKNDGEITTNKTVVNINPIAKLVTFKDGSEVTYNQLIWASDQYTLYQLIENYPRKDFKVQKELLSNSHTNESIFTLSLGLNLNKELFEGTFGCHAFYTPSTLGLKSMTSWKDAKDLDLWVKKYLNLTTYEVSIPVLRDASLAPENQTGVIISTLFDYDLTKHYADNGELIRLKTLMTNEILKVMNEYLKLDLTSYIKVIDIATPLTIESFNSSYKGSITGWALSNQKMPVYTELKDIRKSVLTKIKDIYQCGQWAFAPAGVPTAILTGKLVADQVLKKKGVKR